MYVVFGLLLVATVLNVQSAILPSPSRVNNTASGAATSTTSTPPRTSSVLANSEQDVPERAVSETGSGYEPNGAQPAATTESTTTTYPAATSVGSTDNSTIGGTEVFEFHPPPRGVGWAAKEVPDPRLCPSCCGLPKPGFVCDPDGVFRDPSIGGSEYAAQIINAKLADVANQSTCPCKENVCADWGSAVFVVVVGKLKSGDDKPPNVLISEFAKAYLRKLWLNSDTDCHGEIVVAMSADDAVITTVVGSDITKSQMMTTGDVELVGSVVRGWHEANTFVQTVHILISTYGMFIDHPPVATVLPFGGNVTANATVPPIVPERKEGGLGSTATGLLIAGVIIFVVAIGLSIVMPFTCRRCRKREK